MSAVIPGLATTIKSPHHERDSPLFAYAERNQRASEAPSLVFPGAPDTALLSRRALNNDAGNGIFYEEAKKKTNEGERTIRRSIPSVEIRKTTDRPTFSPTHNRPASAAETTSAAIVLRADLSRLTWSGAPEERREGRGALVWSTMLSQSYGPPSYPQAPSPTPAASNARTIAKFPVISKRPKGKKNEAA